MEYQWKKITTPLHLDSLHQGKVLKIRLNNKDLFLTYHQEQYFAGDAKCPHAGGPLYGGKCSHAGTVVCPWHRYEFSLSSGRTTNGEGYYINTYPVEKREKGLYVGFPIKKWWEFW